MKMSHCWSIFLLFFASNIAISYGQQEDSEEVSGTVIAIIIISAFLGVPAILFSILVISFCCYILHERYKRPSLHNVDIRTLRTRPANAPRTTSIPVTSSATRNSTSDSTQPFSGFVQPTETDFIQPNHRPGPPPPPVVQQQQSEQEGASPFSPPVVQQQQSGQEGVSPPPVVQHQEDESFVPSPPPSYDTLHDYKDSYTEPSLPPPYPGP